MPKQISPVVKIKGKIDQLNFFESKDGYMVQKVGTFNKDRYLTSDTYRIPRRNASEFGIAGKASKLFKKAFNREINRASDSRLTSRVTQTMIKALRTDTTSSFGSRRVEKGNLKALEGLECNVAMAFSACVVPEIPVTIARATGLVNVNLPALIPKVDIKAPSGATHYCLFAAAATVDFAEEKFVADAANTADLLMSEPATVASSLSLTVPANSILPIFVVLGIEFKFIVNGEAFPFTENGSALQVIAIDKLVVPQL